MPFSLRLWGLLAGCGLLLLAACDQLPAVPEADIPPPVVVLEQVTPQDVVLDNLPPSAISGSTATFNVEVRARVNASGADVREVRLVIQAPGPGSALVVNATMTRAGDLYTASVPVTVSTQAFGAYRVLVYAEDARGRTGDAQGVLRFRTEGEPPVIEEVQATPNPFRAPGVLVLTARVSDPDGLANIARVEVSPPGSQGFRMYDDGLTSGDQRANDGIFTASFQISEDGVSAGSVRFTFRAIDLAGQVSAPVSLDVEFLDPIP